MYRLCVWGKCQKLALSLPSPRDFSPFPLTESLFTCLWSHLVTALYSLQFPAFAGGDTESNFFLQKKNNQDRLSLIKHKREWAKRANPPYMTLFPWKLFSIYSWFCVRNCVVILRTPPYWSVRVPSCNFKLWRVIHFTADHAQQSIWRANLVLLSSTSQKISTWKNLARVAAEEQNGPGLWQLAGESGSDSMEIANWGLRYISIILGESGEA